MCPGSSSPVPSHPAKTTTPSQASALPFSAALNPQARQVAVIAATAGALAPGDVVVWCAYPKSSSKQYKCSFNRDTGWAALGAAGFEPVRQVALDDDWSALRFRRVSFIQTMTRSFAMTEAGQEKAARARR